ncbi:MAG: hypothetical protein JNN03_07665 [Rubrivivax sp.]|nr:hypothetical protein [Rubrivivax sp.]
MAAVRPSDDLVARVVAWHNRNPLARRIAPAQVVSVGLVSFPFWVAGADAAPRASPAATPADRKAGETEAGTAPRDESGTAGAGGESTETAGAPAADSPAAPDAAAAAVDAAETPAAGSRLRDRARARAALDGPAAARSRPALHAPPGAGRKSWRAAFEENLLDPHTPREVARFALRHGSSRRPGSADTPVRDLEPRVPGARGAAVARLWVYTAAIDLGAQRVRVLVSPLDTRRVLGPRIVGRGRVGALAGTLVAGLAAGAAVWMPGIGAGRAPAGPGPVAATSPSPAAPVAAAASDSASTVTAVAANATPAPAPSQAELPARTPTPPPAAIATTTRNPTPALAPAASAPTLLAPPPVAVAQVTAADLAPAPPPAAEPDRARGPRSDLFLRDLAPALSDDVRRVAREASEAARNERAARVAAAGPAPSAPATPAAARPTPSAPNAPPASGAPARAAPQPAPTAAPRAAAAPATATATAWAVSTRNLRTRFESEQMLAALRDVAYRNGHGSELKLEVLPTGDDWRAVGWPFATRADAERLRAALAARGLKAEVVQF